MRTSLINNSMLSVVAIELGLHDFVLIDPKAENFNKQFNLFIEQVKKNLRQNGGSTK